MRIGATNTSHKKAKGFTLAELIIVIAIVAILASVAWVSIASISDRSSKTLVESELAKYKAAYDAWMADTGGVGGEQDFKNYIDPQVGNSTYKITSGLVPTYNWSAKTVDLTIRTAVGRINLETGDFTLLD